MKVTIYANYGVLAHEYTPVYTLDAPSTEAYDKLTVEVPYAEVGKDGLGIDQIWVRVPNWGKPLLLREVLFTGRNGEPVIEFGFYHKSLKVLDKAD